MRDIPVPSLRVVLLSALALVLVLFAIGFVTRDDPRSRPAVQISGGGFIFNYRIAEAYYGFTARVMRPLPINTILEASFEDPMGGPPFVHRVRLNVRNAQYALRSPLVRGVEVGKAYHVTLRVLDYSGQTLIESHEREYKSQISSDIVPEKPLTIGPGYAPNLQNQ